MAPVTTLLICEDDESIRVLCQRILEDPARNILLAETGEEAVELYRIHSVDAVLCDVKLPGISGLEVLEEIRRLDPCAIVVIMTAFGTIQNAVEALKRGAFDYITKPFSSPAELSVVMEKAVGQRRLLLDNLELRRAVREKYSFDSIIGKSAAMQPVFRTIEKAAPTDSTMLVRGESGTGKELVARALHLSSRRSLRPFVRVNCSAFTESLLESELFVHVRGAFTGALKDHPGLVAAADGGTLFLDEVGDTGLELQAHLLRVLQDGEYRRVGETRTRTADLRVIGSTNQPLEELIRKGRFREDLYYRLKVIEIHIPPLRERMDDLPLLIKHFLERQSEKQGPRPDGSRRQFRLDPTALAILKQYRWPGNVRELENALERAAVLCEGDVIHPRDLPAELVRAELLPWPSQPGKGLLELNEEEQIRAVLRQTDGHRTKAAEILGITRRTLYEKIKRFGIEL
ncbi:sigma-54-dependent Fis family transcriptional regulator [bacterium]|nr:sigma-54-dependent Fis family transcriptional regulator [bacterium]